MSESQENDPDGRIERSTGEFVSTGLASAVVGGGYRGKREDQDGAVVEFARRLADEFPDYEIEIRYNSDRLGGGAWLRNNPRNNQIGLGADLVAPEWFRQRQDTYREWHDEYGLSFFDVPSVSSLDLDERVLKFSVMMTTPAIAPEKANRESSVGNFKPYYHGRFDTLDDAWAFFIVNVERNGVNPPK